MLQLQIIYVIINSCRFKSSGSDEPRRVQVLDLYCLTRFESEVQVEDECYDFLSLFHYNFPFLFELSLA